MSPRYKEALCEVDYVLDKLQSDDLEKIPYKFREFIKNNKSKIYDITNIDKLKEETLAILNFIYRKYLSPIEEREKLEQEFLDRLKQEKELLKYNKVNSQIDYSPKVIVDNEKKVEISECTDVAEYVQDKWYKRVFYKIKCLFNHKSDR